MLLSKSLRKPKFSEIASMVQWSQKWSQSGHEPNVWKTALPSIFSHATWNENLPKKNGYWMEFGVKAGASIIYPASLHQDWIMWGFDSFEGLPDGAKGTPWKKGGHKTDFGDIRIQTVAEGLPNVRLVKGWFKDSIPRWRNETYRSGEKVSFVHIDSDLYASAKDVLDNIGDLLLCGATVVFDNYVWRHTSASYMTDHEVKAWYDFLNRSGRMVEVVGSMRHSAVFRIWC